MTKKIIYLVSLIPLAVITWFLIVGTMNTIRMINADSNEPENLPPYNEDELEIFYEVSKNYCSIEEIEDYKKGICEPDGAESGGCCMSREYQVFLMSRGGGLDVVMIVPIVIFGLLDLVVIPLILIYVYRRGKTLFFS